MGDPKRRDNTGQRPDLASLRAQVRAIERGAGTADQVARCSLGLEALDHHLGGGFALGRVHEITGEARGELRDASVFGFTAALLVRLLDTVRGGDILWCVRDANMVGGMAHGRGLAALGLDMDRVLFVRARDEAVRLWAMEEGLRCTGLAGVVGELGPARAGEAARIAERRLQLAAEASGVTGFLVRSLAGQDAAGCAVGRRSPVRLVALSRASAWRAARRLASALGPTGAPIPGAGRDFAVGGYGAGSGALCGIGGCRVALYVLFGIPR